MGIKQIDKNIVQLTGFDLFVHLQKRSGWSEEETIEHMKEHGQDVSFFKEFKRITDNYKKELRERMINKKGVNSFNRYKQNLRATEDHIYSYDTKVAEIDHKNKQITPLGWWSVTTSKHINYVGSEYGYEVQKIN